MPLVILKVFPPLLLFLPVSKLVLFFECTHRVLTNISIILICQCRIHLFNPELSFRGLEIPGCLGEFLLSLSIEGF